MNIKSERGQAVIVLALLALGILALAFLGLSASMPGMKRGADTIGNTVGSAIDNASTAEEQEWRNVEWQVLNGTVSSFWVNGQRIYPNRHSKLTHPEGEAEKATDCYNDHGAFMSLANKSLDFYLPCREEDGTVRLTVWKRESATSSRFHLESAYTPKGGNWTRILDWLRNTHRAGKASFPPDAVLVIDGIIP